MQQRANELRDKLSRSDQIYMMAFWKDWLDDAFIMQLQRAQVGARAKGVDKRTIQNKILRHDEGPQDEKERAKCRKGFQKTARSMLEEHNKANLEHTLRKKLQRWTTGLFPRLLGPRMQHGLQIVGKHGTPRVAAALLRANMNGWVTERRMQIRNGCGCGLGCAEAEDSIEHYACCPRVWDIARTRLRIQRPGQPEEDTRSFLGLDRHTSINDRLKMALLTYGLYCYLNERRHKAIPAVQAPSYIWQAIKNGA